MSNSTQSDDDDDSFFISLSWYNTNLVIELQIIV